MRISTKRRRGWEVASEKKTGRFVVERVQRQKGTLRRVPEKEEKRDVIQDVTDEAPWDAEMAERSRGSCEKKELAAKMSGRVSSSKTPVPTPISRVHRSLRGDIDPRRCVSMRVCCYFRAHYDVYDVELGAVRRERGWVGT